MENDQQLAILESNLRKEASGYLKKCEEAGTSGEWIERQVLSLTGCEFSDMGLDDAKGRISRMLDAQTRWSRTRHPRYDLNRHITLRKLYRSLAEIASFGSGIAKNRQPGCLPDPPVL